MKKNILHLSILVFWFLLVAVLPAFGGRALTRIGDLRHGSGGTGPYRALIIAINDYEDPAIPDLETPLNDAGSLDQLLTERYGFKTELLLGKKASKRWIYNALRSLAGSAQPDESVLIYYAGHGDYDRQYDDGWWVPYDAKGGDTVTYLDNVQVQKAMKSMKARHVLLVSDSCYSGTLFGSYRAVPPAITDNYYLNLYNEKSRWGMTSGNREPVSDSGTDGHSVFAYQMVKALRKNRKKIYPVLELYTEIAPIIGNNSNQVPLCRPVRGTGDQGGQFLFLLAGSGAWTDMPIRRSETLDRVVESRGALYVDTVPENAKVRVLNIRPVFYQGMELDAGQYHLEVSKRGFETRKQWITVEAGEDKSIDIRLAKMAVSNKPGRIKNSLGMDFVYIGPGRFMMGSPASEPGRDSDEKRHEVTLTRGYYMQATEVTQGQWQALMGTRPWAEKDYYVQEHRYNPAVYISWNDCREFIRRLNRNEGTHQYRLPTEAEWEYACRGGRSSAYSFGDDSARLGDWAWYDMNAWDMGEKYAHRVGQKRSNPLGLFDMHGNVWEWCEDRAEYKNGVVTDTYRHGIVDPVCNTGPYRVGRGGSWDYGARYCRSANRDSGSPGYRYFNLGFRLVRTP